jgi:arsenite methyltransferase
MGSAEDDVIRNAVRERYGDIAREGNAARDCGPSSCCEGTEAAAHVENYDEQSSNMGYSMEELACAPEGANMGLGCGNPQAIAALKPGETVLDLGSGAGFDCFLASKQVGSTGRVIGVDMTPDMISKARENTRKGSYANVEFRLGEIEHLPVANATIDVIISNCVINLSTDKPSVFHEAYRVLKFDGRLAISDVVATAKLPTDIRNDLALYSACVAGAVFITDLESMLADIGFADIQITPKDESREFIREWAPGHNLEEYIQSASIEARKPAHP